MEATELHQRIKAVKQERAKGYYVDALELERDLLRELAVASGPLRDAQLRLVVRELEP